MKKRLVCAMILALGIVLVSGCAGGTNGKEGQGTEQGSVEASQAGTQTGGSTGLLAEGQKASDFVKLGEYKGLTITAVPETYEDEDYDIQMRQIYFSYVTDADEVKDRPVEKYDMVNIDYEGKKDGVAFEGGTAQGFQLLIGSHSFIDGFEDGLIGVMPGETVDLNLKFPEGYRAEELAGQDVVFTVTVNSILVMKDERVSEIGAKDVTTLTELHDFVVEGMKEQAQENYLSAAQDEIWTQLMENVVFEEFPEEMVDKSREDYAVILDQMAASYGTDAESYAQMLGMSYEDMLSQYAEGYARQLLMIQAIADAENLNLTEDALKARIDEYAAGAGLTEADLLANGLTTEDFRQSYLYEDVLNFLVENAKKVNG